MATVPEEGDSPWLRLVLRRLRTFEGRIVSANGGVPGAMVQAWSPFVAQGSASTSNIDQAISDAEGRFRVELPVDAAILNLLVLPPGFALRLLTLAWTPGQAVEIPVEPSGGTLVLELATEGSAPLLVHGGTFTLPQMLSAWARMQGARSSDPRRLVVPNVEPTASAAGPAWFPGCETEGSRPWPSARPACSPPTATLSSRSLPEQVARVRPAVFGGRAAESRSEVFGVVAPDG
jgi:hypothetical protein